MNQYQHKILLRILFAVPAVSILVAYAAIAIYTQNAWPWLEPVHESGDRTLIDTILYFEHAAREMPLDFVLGVAIGGSVLFVLPRQAVAGWTDQRRVTRMLLLAAMTVFTIIVGGTLGEGGLELLGDNVFQKHTRPDEPLVWGAHWRYHLLSRISLILGSIGFAAAVLVATLGLRCQGHRTGAVIFAIAVAIFLGLSILFGIDADPFVDPVFLGHQVREVFTHALVTVPLSWGVCIYFVGWNKSSSPAATVHLMFAGVGGILAISVGLFLVASGFAASAVSHGQTQSLTLLICPHFFEHSFSYVVVPIVAAATCQLPAIARKCFQPIR